MTKRRPTREQIEGAAAEIIKIVTPHSDGGWTPEFIAKAKWPKDFLLLERKFARRIAKAALNGAFK